MKMNQITFPFFFCVFIAGLYFVGFSGLDNSRVEVVLEKEKIQKYELVGLNQAIENLQREKKSIQGVLHSLEGRKEQINQQRNFIILVRDEAIGSIALPQKTQAWQANREHLATRQRELEQMRELYK